MPTFLTTTMALLVPYLPAPYRSLPQAIAYHSSSSIGQFYTTVKDPAHTVAPLFLTSMVGAYVAGVVTGNVSQVDRMWTFLPVLYSAHFALFPLYNNNGWKYAHNLPRLLLMLGLQMIWSGRLSYNTYRRGLFGFFEEDYRWPVWRKLVPAWLFALFHLGFIAITQSILLLMIALPLHSVLVTPSSEVAGSSWIIGLTGSDILLAAATLITLYIQWCSDNQQYTFQNYKHSYLASQKNGTSQPSHSIWRSEFSLLQVIFTPEDAQRGYITRGLWSWSRHPNFACEQTFWALQGLFAVLGTNPGMGTRRMLVLSNPLWGGLALSFLFQASTAFTEWITSNKYPTYSSYQHLVGEFLPQETVLRGLAARLLGKKKEWAKNVWGRGDSTVGKSGTK